MKSNSPNLSQEALSWLSNQVFPLWMTHGIDPQNGAFVESLSHQGEPMPVPRRAMVQARQIYSFVEGAHLKILPRDQVQNIVRRASDHFMTKYSQPNGAFIHSVDVQGHPADQKLDLYTQAFGIFGLAAAFDVLRDTALKKRAKEAIAYLKNERALKAGGYSELADGKVTYAANPHMHLFEAAIAWMRVDSDPVWADFAKDIYQLCREKFIDRESGGLAEHFDSNWTPLREADGFVWEPGHHHEWAWLMVQYAEAAKTSVDALAQGLFRKAEDAGLDRKSGFVFDEVWSTGKIKKSSSRFWPQSERIKAAVSLGDAQAADQALTTLFKYFKGIKPGLWQDTLANGEFVSQPAKASSLYHIINAISEYAKKRPAI